MILSYRILDITNLIGLANFGSYLDMIPCEDGHLYVLLLEPYTHVVFIEFNYTLKELNFEVQNVYGISE